MQDHAEETPWRFIATQWLSDVDHRVVVAASDELVVGFMTARVSPSHPVLHGPTTVLITDAYVAP